MTFEKLQADMIAAMKARDKQRKEAISSLVQAVKKAAIDQGCRDNIPESMVDQAINKELRAINEQVASCPASREDLLAEYTFKRDVILEYAPKMLSKEEILEVLKRDFAEVLATGNKGAVMKTVMPALKGKADGKLINQCVAELMK